jgi:cytochrome d ubiquinol oxidase subunit I
MHGPADCRQRGTGQVQGGGDDVSAVDLARLQFATTAIYHFLFVPVTIGLAFLTAMLQTWWHRTERPELLRLTRFFGTLLAINVAVGVVTGLVQEFQFGMNWSGFSRFVGDVFGAQLAMEGLAAFFLESTFLGLWLFGWGKLSRRLHLATIWAVAIGSALSAAFIMAANSWMQHPVGYQLDPVTGRAQLTDIWAMFTNPVFYWGYAHVLLAALLTAAVLMLGISAWHIRRGSQPEVFTRSAGLAIAVLLPVALLIAPVGGRLGVNETNFQPMKIAAAEAQWETCQPCSFSVLQIGGFDSSNQTPTKIIEIPHLLSVLATSSWDGQVLGLNEVQAQYTQQYGPGNYIPPVAVQYFSMRTMAYLAVLMVLLGLWGFWRRRRLASSPLFLRVAIWVIPLPFLMNTAGWLLTESGRQPWIVQGLQQTQDANSPSVDATAVLVSLSGFVLLYLLLAAVDAVLMFRFARRELAPDEPLPGDETPALETSY